MSFRQLFKKGSLGDLSERVSTPDRGLAAAEPPKASDPPGPAKSTRVLYITGDLRESRIVSGAFSHTHPHLDFDFSVEFPRRPGSLAQAASK